MEYNFYLAIALAMSIAVGVWGSKRRIGFWYAFIISATLSPILGLIITAVSPSWRSPDAYKEVKNKYLPFVIVLWCVSLIFILKAIPYFDEAMDASYKYQGDYNSPIQQGVAILLFAIGFFTWGIYLFKMPQRMMPVEIELQNK